MEYIKTEGIIISEVNTGEADKSITILTRDFGKIYAYARNARRFKGKVNSAVSFLSYGEFVLRKRKESYSVDSFELLESFYEVRKNLKKLTYAAHMADVLKFAVQEEQPSAKILKLFLNTLYFLAVDESERPPEMLCSIFELRTLSIMGYAPQQCNACSSCGAELDESDGDALFSFEECGFICRECKKKGIPASVFLKDTARAVCHITACDNNLLFGFRISERVLAELSGFSERYLRERLDHDFKKLELIHDL